VYMFEVSIENIVVVRMILIPYKSFVSSWKFVTLVTYVSIYIYIERCFKTSGDAYRLPYSIAFYCSIRPFLDLFYSRLLRFLAIECF